MVANDIPMERRDQIAERLANGHSVIASALALEFNVSEDAIRRDLRALAAEGLCRRVYGGALPLTSDSPPMSVRMSEGQEQKAHLAKTGVRSIQPGEFVFLDNGSTNLALAKLLPEDHELKVATNSLVIAAELLQRPDIELIVLGGSASHQLGGCVDGNALLALVQLNIDRAFIGACALSRSHGIGAFNSADAMFKRQLLARSQHKIVLATNEKVTLRAPHKIGELNELTELIVEHDLPDRDFQQLKSMCPSVVRADRGH
ncbi:DeoR/GlpR family DNA-binding transcription regulator [Marinobacter nanhaiticus D15-8W]|uniref:DeoR/GlpR transcriptional regulator n=1 Tax=Marinobacter nanhaiticus D15-8W TaxID=626887 RepID=N6WZ27_9GAMM|nr:DeoR/GlpR family DNA-binding transcription regulator [Marinobacter nanhaiticus]ENO14028.1 DeoR/GlpR transcriptional regulator [Marinobacter nanhaiticus D15-8W]BES71408.1 DeoR/GlpR family DNA-binding transcription regulator [Marinobacter nanhaiticus D15-8W]